jgi:hypothetical protein
VKSETTSLHQFHHYYRRGEILKRQDLGPVVSPYDITNGDRAQSRDQRGISMDRSDGSFHATQDKVMQSFMSVKDWTWG